MHDTIELARTAVLNRLEMAKLSELIGTPPWTLISNHYNGASIQPSVSVVITLYNYAKHIIQCLDSVCASDISTLPNGFEILVIDDGSTDQSTQLTTDFLEKHPDIPITLVKKLFNTGLADARNVGLKLARAPYIFILDADNWIYPNCLSVLYQAIQSSNTAAAYGIIKKFDDSTGEQLGSLSDRAWNPQALVQAPYIDAMAMFNREIVLELGGYSTELIQYGWFGWEDYDLWLKLAQAHYSCEFVPQVVCAYRVHPQSMIKTTQAYEHRLAQYFTKKFSNLIDQYAGWDRLFCVLTPEEVLQITIDNPSVQQWQVQEKLNQTEVQLNHLRVELQKKQDLLDAHHTQLEALQLQLENQQLQVEAAHQQTQAKQTKIQSLRGKLQEKQALLVQLRDRILAMESSKFWQLRLSWFKFKSKLGLAAATEADLTELPVIDDVPKSQPTRTEPQPSPSHPKLSPQTAYERWLCYNTPTEAELERMSAIAKVLAYQPTISIVMPVYNTPERYLREAIESVQAQIYPNWELCIADDASPNSEVRSILQEYTHQDDRIKTIYRTENGHISRCSNSALELATGEFIGLLDHDDRLSPDALYEVVLLLNQHPEADMIYSDEDKIDDDNIRRHPYFKPDWSPDSFLSQMYTCHFGVYRRDIIHKIGGFRTGFEGSQDYDLVLRFTEHTEQVFHIPQILYHWRIHPESAASGSAAKPYAYVAAQKALSEALERRGEKGEVQEVEGYPGQYIIRYHISDHKLVSIIIPTKDLGHILNQCLDSIFTKSTYPNYEVILIDNGSMEPHTEKVISDWLNREPDRFKCYKYNLPFNYSKINNFAVTKAQGDFLLFLNNDTEVITPDWIEGMVEQSQRQSVGAVGATLLYPDNTIQHAGIILGIANFAGHSHKHLPATTPGYFGRTITINNYSAVTGACLMCKREVFKAVGGFNEELTISCNDVEMCLKLIDKGYRNVCLPHVKLYHYESKSRGQDITPEKKARFLQETELMYRDWRTLIERDPYYNPNLTLEREDYSIGEHGVDGRQVKELNVQLKQTQTQLRRSQTKLQRTQEELDQTKNRIVAMETSKFWQLRQRWFQVKRSLGLPTEE